MQSSRVLREAVEGVGVKQAAAAVGVSTSLFYKWCQPRRSPRGARGSGAANPLDRLAALVEATGSDLPVRWLAGRAGGFFTRNPKARTDPEIDILRQTRRIVAEFADVLESLERSLADGRIEPAEAEKIRREWEQLKSAGEGLVVSCEERAEGSES
jgi:hypothetical protein